MKTTPRRSTRPFMAPRIAALACANQAVGATLLALSPTQATAPERRSVDFDPAFGTALNAAAAIRDGKISSVELTQHTLRRIDAYEPALNAYVYLLRDEALAAAARADESLARGTATGALHGVPINVKESFAVAGQPSTWGIPALKESRAPAPAVAAPRLLDAGAILLGGTNLPFQLKDHQTFNDIWTAAPTTPGTCRAHPEDPQGALPPPWRPGWRSSASDPTSAGLPHRAGKRLPDPAHGRYRRVRRHEVDRRVLQA